MTTETTDQESVETQSPSPEIASGDEATFATYQNAGDQVRASWNFSADTLARNTAYMNPETRELLRWTFSWCNDPEHPIRMQEFAELTGHSYNAWWRIFNGKYVDATKKTHTGSPVLLHPSEKFVKSLRAFKRVQLQRSKLGREKFVHTETAKKIFAACDLARESQTPAFIEGASQIGKTSAFKQYCIDNNHGKSVLIELWGFNGLGGLMRALATKLGVSANANNSDMVHRIMRSVTRDMVLIFDEVHVLANTFNRKQFLACMEFIRRLGDFSKCGIVLSFTNLGFITAEKGRKQELEQIFRRGVHHVNLGDRPTNSDVRAIIKAWELEIPARNEEVTVQIGKNEFTERPYAMLGQLAREQGLKAIVERLRYAGKFAADADASLSWEHVVTAHFAILRNAQVPDHGWAE